MALVCEERMCRKCTLSGFAVSPTLIAVRNWGRVLFRCVSCVRQEYVSSLLFPGRQFLFSSLIREILSNWNWKWGWIVESQQWR